MIYLLLSAVCAYAGVSVSLGATTLLRPLMDAVSPLPPESISTLCTMSALVAALLCAFSALSRPIPLAQDELISLAAGAAVGGVIGDLISARFMAMLPAAGVVLLTNGLFFTLLALSFISFSVLRRTLRPLALSRITAAVPALFLGLLASFLSFGAQPLTIAAYALLYDAQEDEAAAAALAVSLCAMASKLVTMLVRSRFILPDAPLLLWLFPGIILGVLLGLLPLIRFDRRRAAGSLTGLALFAALINIARSLIR